MNNEKLSPLNIEWAYRMTDQEIIDTEMKENPNPTKESIQNRLNNANIIRKQKGE